MPVPGAAAPLLKPQANHTYRWAGWRLKGKATSIDSPEPGYWLDLHHLRNDPHGTVAHTWGKDWGKLAMAGLLGAIRDLGGHEVDVRAAVEARFEELTVTYVPPPAPVRIYCEDRCAIDHAERCQRCASPRPGDDLPDNSWCQPCRRQWGRWRRAEEAT